MSPITLLVLGGARSGKSRYAQSRAEALPGRRLFVATAQPFDDEMATRIARHRDDRGPDWQTVEAPLDLPQALADHAAADAVILVDCLTLWTSNLMLAERDIPAATAALIAVIAQADCPVILVSNEVGLGVVPDNALARRFRDAVGRVPQRLAAEVREVVFMVAGLPMTVKGP